MLLNIYTRYSLLPDRRSLEDPNRFSRTLLLMFVEGLVLTLQCFLPSLRTTVDAPNLFTSVDLEDLDENTFAVAGGLGRNNPEEHVELTEVATDILIDELELFFKRQFRILSSLSCSRSFLASRNCCTRSLEQWLLSCHINVI